MVSIPSGEGQKPHKPIQTDAIRSANLTSTSGPGGALDVLFALMFPSVTGERAPDGKGDLGLGLYDYNTDDPATQTILFNYFQGLINPDSSGNPSALMQQLASSNPTMHKELLSYENCSQATFTAAMSNPKSDLSQALTSAINEHGSDYTGFQGTSAQGQALSNALYEVINNFNSLSFGNPGSGQENQLIAFGKAVDALWAATGGDAGFPPPVGNDPYIAAIRNLLSTPIPGFPSSYPTIEDFASALKDYTSFPHPSGDWSILNQSFYDFFNDAKTSPMIQNFAQFCLNNMQGLPAPQA